MLLIWDGADIYFSTQNNCQNCAVFETICKARIIPSKLKYIEPKLSVIDTKM